MAVVGAEAFAVGGEPGTNYLVFCAREEDVAVFGVSMGSESEEAVRVEGDLSVRRASLDLSQGPFL